VSSSSSGKSSFASVSAGVPFVKKTGEENGLAACCPSRIFDKKLMALPNVVGNTSIQDFSEDVVQPGFQYIGN